MIQGEEIEKLLMGYTLPTSKLNAGIEDKLNKVSKEEIRSYQIYRVNKVLKTVSLSPFWQRKLNYTTEIQTFKDLENIQPTSRREIDDLFVEGRWNELLTVNDMQLIKIFRSGGTTHKAPFFSRMNENEYTLHVADIMRMFSLNGIKPGDLILNTFPGKYISTEWVTKINIEYNHKDFISDHVAGTIIHDGGQRYGLQVISSGLQLLAYKKSKPLAITEGSRILKICKMVKPRILAISPHLLKEGLMPILENVNLQSLGVEIILFGGSTVDSDTLKGLEKDGIKVISWLESGEVCTIAYSNMQRTKDGDFIGYVPTWFSNLFEIVDEQGYQLPIGQRGRLLVTRLTTFDQPLIRYDTEDDCRLIEYEGKILFDRTYTKTHNNKSKIYPV